MVILVCLLFWGVAALVLLGWLAPLIVGVRRRRRGEGGRVLVGVGAAWGLLAASLVAMLVNCVCQWRGAGSHETPFFDPASYKGEVATLELGYGVTAELELRAEGPGGTTWWNVCVTNGAAVVPAGELQLDDLSLSVTDASGKRQGTLYVSLAPENQSLKLSQGERRRLPGGFPLTASIEASKRDEGLSLNFKMLDAAGNRCVWYPEGEGRKPPAFEAAASDGRCIWRDNFEYG
jgi:hypothetical protein